METKPYLKYLDKEMTIMGILSAVSIAAPAAILNAILGDHALTAELWKGEKVFIAWGSVFCVVAALLFYRQRSLLAWHYGQICLVEALNAAATPPVPPRELIRSADSWATWTSYSWGFTALVGGGLFGYLSAIFFWLVAPYCVFLLANLRTAKIMALCLSILWILVASGVQGYVLSHYKFADGPWTSFFGDIRFLLRPHLPHENVYTRLQTSPIHGVGVFAIRDIPKDTYVFEPDDGKLVTVCAKKISDLSSEIRKLYTDFCVSEGDVYQCPQSFNELTPTWFLNNSKTPNMAADMDLKFYAIRDIPAGEELTADYTTYSQTPLIAEPAGLDPKT